MAYEVEAFGKIIEVPDDVPKQEAYKQIMANRHKLDPDYVPDKPGIGDKLNALAKEHLGVDSTDVARAFSPAASIADQAEASATEGENTAAPQVPGAPVRQSTYNKALLDPSFGIRPTERFRKPNVNGVLDRTRIAANEDIKGQANQQELELLRTEALKPSESDFTASALNSAGRTIKGAGQVGSDFLGADKDNAITQYGQKLLDNNPLWVKKLGDIRDEPFLAFKEASGNSVPSMGAMVGVGALGAGIASLAPLTGPAAPIVAAVGTVVQWLGPAAVAALPSYSGIRDAQILKDPKNEADAKSKAIAAIGASAVGAIEVAFGPQQWAIAMLTKEGRAAMARKFASTSIGEAAIKGGVLGAVQEGSEEIVQNPIEQLASYEDPTTKKNLLDTAFGGAMGAIGGSLPGAATGAASQVAQQANIDKLKPIADAPTVDDAIAAAHEAVAPKEDVLRTVDPTLADIEALTGVKPNETQAAKILDIVLPDNTSVKAQWKIVDADQLAASMKEDVNQPRDRTRAASDVQIKSIANAPDYRRLSDSPVMDVGAPVVDQDGRIVAGNGRFAGLSQAYEQGTATEYINQLREDVARKGLSIEGIAKPVLVRQLSEPVDTRKLAIASNSGTTLQMSALEQAKLDAERMKGIENLDVNDLGDIALTPRNLTQLKDSLGTYAGTELGAMVDKGGKLSQEGMRRVRNAMLAKAYGNSHSLEKLVESTDSDMRNVLGALTKSANHIIKTKGNVKPLMEAVDTYSQLKATGQPVDNFLAQQDAFSEGLSKDAEGILRFIDTNVRSQKKLTDFFKGNFVETDTTSADMFATPQKPLQSVEPKPDRDGRHPNAKAASKIASWVIKNKATGEILFETFDKAKVDALNTSKYEAVPIYEHLTGLNKDASITKLEKHLKDAGYDFTVEPASVRDIDALDSTKKARKELAEKQAKLFKKKVVFVKADGPFKINGVMVPGIADTIFVDIRTDKAFDAIMAHELSHWMEQEKPAVYKQMIKSLKTVIINEAEYAKKYGIEGATKAEITKEIVGDLMGDNFTKQSFWQKVAEANPEAFKDIAAAIIKWLKGVIVKAKANGMGSEQWVKDATKAQDIIAKAVAQYTESETVPVSVESKPKFNASPKTVTVDGIERPTTNSEGKPINNPVNFWKWFGDSKVVDDQGRPRVVYHGTDKAFSKVNVKKGAQNLFWFSSDKESILAGESGASSVNKIMPLYVRIEGPANWDQYGKLGIYEFSRNNLDGAMLSKGNGQFDGFVLGGSQVKSVDNNGDFSTTDMRLKFSKAEKIENTLIAQHNLSVRNLIHADRMGGLAAPSIAVTDKAHPLTGFGEITLLSHKDLIDPKNGTKIFGSDIYSPRYPSISYDFSGKPIKALNAILADGAAATGDSSYYNDNLQNDPFRELLHRSAAMYTFLSEQGKEPDIKFTEIKELSIESLKPFADGTLDSFDMSKDEGFKEAIRGYWAEKFDGEKLDEDQLRTLARSYANDVVAYRDSKRNVGKVDRQATNSALFRQILDSDLRNKFDTYLVDLVNRVEPKERIFKGYTYSGNRQYLPHDIDTVIKILKKDLRGGENVKYGLGSIRAKYSPQFKSIEHIRKSKGMLMDSASFDQVKKEVQAELDELNESLASYGTFSGYDNVETMLSDAAKRGISGALKDNGFENVPDSIKVDIQTFLNKLKDMPTEYFEAKILRAVGLGEFSTAVIPDDSTPQVEAILKKNGIEDIRKYKSGDNEDRVKQINKVTHVMFSRAPKLYSKLEQALEAANDKVFSTGPQVKLWLQSNAGKMGIKKDEIYWSGIDNWLDAQGKVSKQQVVEFVRNNGVKVKDVTLGEKPTQDDLSRVSKERYGIPFGQLSTSDQRDLMDELDASGAKHNNDKLTLPGGTDYKELVVTVPTIEPHNADDGTHFGDTGQGKQIGWLRMDTRDGGLFIEELQSQRAQEGRTKGFVSKFDDIITEVSRLKIEGYIAEETILNPSKPSTDPDNRGFIVFDGNNRYGTILAGVKGKTEQDAFETLAKRNIENRRNNQVPPAPFVSDANNKATNAYITLLMKKALIEAVSNDHASVSWTTGDQQSERYDLSKQINMVSAISNNNGTYNLIVEDKSGNEIDPYSRSGKRVTPAEMEEVIGKDLTKKVVAGADLVKDKPWPKSSSTNPAFYTVRGVDLKIGGEWAQSMYGNEQGLNLQGKPSLISQAANDIFKHVGSGKVESINGQPGFYVTPEMKSKDLPLFSFAGPKAETADKYTLETAQQRIAAGDPDDTVRQETGWFKGIDGKWRFEINDSDAKLTTLVDTMKGQKFGDIYNNIIPKWKGSLRVKDILNHPKLFEAYPKVADTRVNLLKGGGASFNRDTGAISVGDDVSRYDMKSVLLHEIQHSIQTNEGFATGGNVESARRAAADIVTNKLNDINSRIIELGVNRSALKGDEYLKNVELHKTLVKEKDALNDELEGLKYDMAPAANAYKRLAGEVEARNTQTRMGFTDEERRLLPPYSSQDIPDSDQIIVYNGVEMRSEPDTVVVDGVERPTTNSEGKPINKPVNFWKWFGDSEARLWPKSSRGDRKMAPPLVFYHGTKGDFNEFVIGSPGTNSTVFGPWETKRAGMFFTQDKKFAESFATQGDSTQNANVMPVYLKVENAIDLTEGFTDDTIIEALAEKGVNPRLMRNISADQIWGMFDEEDDGSFFVSKLKDLGYDGAIIVEPNIATEDSVESWVVFSPNQIKSAIGNNGDYSRTNNDIRFSKEPSKPTPPDESRLRRFQRMNQDSFNRFTVIKEWLAENGQTLSDKADVYGAEERYHSMAANQLEDFREQQRNPLIEKIQKAGYTLGDIEVFLKMQHTPEANAANRKLTGNTESTAAGISDEDANEYLAEAPENLAKLANELRDITEQTKKLRLDAGILNTDITGAWENTYKFYVPMKGEADSTRGVGKGLKTNFKSKRRLGHSLRDEHVIENILMDHERAILEVERNRVGKHLVMMAAEMQRPDILSIEQPEKRKMLKESTAYTVEANGVVQGVFKSREEAKMFKQFYAASIPKVAPSAIVINQTKDQRVIASASPMLAENEVNVYMNGHAIRVQINDELLARAYTKLGVEQFSDIVGAGRILNGYLSKVYTGYNPEFILTNMIRDFSSGTINLTGEQGFGMATKALTNYPRMFTDLLKYAATNGKSSTKWIDAYRKNGGNTGAAYLSDMERLGNEVNTEYASYQGVLANIKQGDNANAARAAGRKVFNVTLKWIYNLNQAGENAMRLAAFKAMIDSGRTVNEAAKVAKNITVNFNRKGERQWTAALYLFYNASVQGTAATAHALTKGKHKGQAWALAGSMAAVGYMMAASFGGGDEDDWDEINDYTKERNMLIKSGDGYVKVPVPYGYGFFWNFGRHIAEAQRTGELGTMPWHLATSAISEFTPFNDVVVGSDEEFRSDQVFMGLLPTAMKIVAQPTFNKQLFTGSELMPESERDKSQPDRQKMFRSTKGTMYDTVAGWLDSAGIDVSPETLKYITRTGTGGAGSLVDTGISAAMLKAEGAELDIQEIPFVRKAYMELGIKDKRAAYYKVREEARTAAEEFNRARRDNDVAKMQDVLKDKKELIALDRYANKLAATIDAARDQQDAVRADKNLSVQEKRLKLKDMEATEAKFYDQYLDVFKTSKR